jgi:hypothetical protein
MAQDPERDDERPEAGDVDLSHDLDMEPLYFSQTIEAEVEAEVIRGVLEANGIPAIVSASPVPSLGFQIQVPKNRMDDALRVIAEQEAAGPEAAAEAEAATEE